MFKLNTSWTRALPTDLVINLATLGPIGKWNKMPGTLGSIVGLVWYTLFFYSTSLLRFLLLLAITVYLAIAFCGEAEKRLQRKDSPQIILDEMVAVPLCFLGVDYLFASYPVWLILLVGFGIFRVFDIFKPFFIKKLQNYPGGLGVVLDDLGAALLTTVCLHLFFGILHAVS